MVLRRSGGNDSMAEPGRILWKFQSDDQEESGPVNTTVVRQSSTATEMAVIDQVNGSRTELSGMSHP